MEKDFMLYIKDKNIDLIVVSDAEAILGIGGTSLVHFKIVLFHHTVRFRSRRRGTLHFR